MASRQRAALDDIVARVERAPHLLGAVLIGSLTDGGDALSDVDLIVVASAGMFATPWRERCALHPDGILVCWDVGGEDGAVVGAHKWVTADVVLVEALLTEPTGGARLAPPHAVLVGPSDLATTLRAWRTSSPRAPAAHRSNRRPLPFPSRRSS
jgi:hypothetical protein